MKVDNNTKYDAAITVNWLRKCSETTGTLRSCDGCPFDDGIANCMDRLHAKAADLLEQLAGLTKRQPKPADPEVIQKYLEEV